MFLERLELADFRNFTRFEHRFESLRVIFLGANAQGKTNLLEAIATLATGSSPFAVRDAEMVRWGERQTILRSTIGRRGTTTQLDLLIPQSGRRAIKVDGAHQRRLADILGLVQVVLFSREDLELVRGAPSGRRDFLDRLLVQLQPVYFEELRKYERSLSQRNSVLKRIAEGTTESSALEPWNGPLIRLGAELASRRARAIAELAPRAAEWHARISACNERLELSYVPGIPLPERSVQEAAIEAWLAAYASSLEASRSQEIGRRQTIVGPHRDDFALQLDGHPARAFASTGQRRTLALALKLAELELLKEAAGEPPVLLLDDVLAELDVSRQNHLLAAIGTHVQTFVTTTHLADFSADWIDRAEIWILRAGTIHPATAEELAALAASRGS
ncbi:MAG: DNA replication/repair protein RecF [Cyanobacteria bacterium REEB65]|nr:DNA replication/repair protein RecF [Cyanobacteria bacterium REEB65]